MVYPAAGWRGTALPPFPALAASICATLQLARLHALLPPGDDVVDRWTGGWTTTTGRLTYLLDLTSGLEAVWAGAKGRMRTAVRRARALGVHAAEGEPGQASRLVELYGDTMGRHDVTHRYTEADFRFLLDGSTGSALVTVARDDHGVQAASVFAVGDRTAYHVMQTISAEGRRTNAGYLALWEAITALSHRGIQLVDLGSAAAPGQERFKTDWGGLARPTRLVRWEKEPKP
ncbi:GNAT family N-acetyltransferase [Streptomyces lasalocidi]